MHPNNIEEITWKDQGLQNKRRDAELREAIRAYYPLAAQLAENKGELCLQISFQDEKYLFRSRIIQHGSHILFVLPRMSWMDEQISYVTSSPALVLLVMWVLYMLECQREHDSLPDKETLYAKKLIANVVSDLDDIVDSLKAKQLTGKAWSQKRFILRLNHVSFVAIPTTGIHQVVHLARACDVVDNNFPLMETKGSAVQTRNGMRTDGLDHKSQELDNAGELSSETAADELSSETAADELSSEAADLSSEAAELSGETAELDKDLASKPLIKTEFAGMNNEFARNTRTKTDRANASNEIDTANSKVKRIHGEQHLKTRFPPNQTRVILPNYESDEDDEGNTEINSKHQDHDAKRKRKIDQVALNTTKVARKNF